MTLAELFRLWDDRDERYAEARQRPSWAMTEAARAYRLREASLLGERKAPIARRRVASWKPGGV
jgi:hypothetical protein